MGLRPFNRFSNIRWSLLAAVFLVAAGTVFLPPGTDRLSAGQPPAKPKEPVEFKGKWNGKYLDNMNGKGQGEYEFGEEKDGRFTVNVSWEYEGKPYVMELTGERLGPDAMRLVGVHKGITYRYIGGMEKSDLVLHWIGEDGKPEKPYFGVSWLTRKK